VHLKMHDEEAPGPVTQASAPQAPGRPGPEGAPDVSAAATKAVTVLVADDNEVAQRLCRRVLEKAGHRVLTASDGQEAVNIALADVPDMILMDVAMPGMDGLEAMRQIRAQKPSMVVVIASAHSMTGDRERFLAAGANDVLSKPFRLNDLTSVVDKLVGGGHPA
jgi:CheY-like chemotaxis protein